MKHECEKCHDKGNRPRVKLRFPECQWLHQRCRPKRKERGRMFGHRPRRVA